MTPAQSLRQAAGILLAEADRLEGKASGPNQMTSYAGRSVTIAEAWAFMLEEIAARAKPHEWRDWTPGTPPGDSGDNSDTPETDDFMRAFKPMMDAAGQQQVKDGNGQIFFAPNIRKRGGWKLLKQECLVLVMSEWGKEWMEHELNVKAGIVPKPAAIAKLVQEVQASY